MSKEQSRSSFSSKLGFVLAAAGSAVGLGNLWRFPYLAAKYGGGIFLLVYLILAVTFGFALMTAEIGLGRRTRQSVIGAYTQINKKFAFQGWVSALIPAIILPYYSVIGGWVLRYLISYLDGQGVAAAQDGYFGSFIGNAGMPELWFIVFLTVTAIVVLTGVQEGIEKVSKVMMPVLAVLTLALAIYVCCRPGAVDGIIYYLKPDFSQFSMKTVLAAMGQLFYSMSLAMGIMVTYGSYMKSEARLESSVRQIEIFDTAIAFLAGLIIVPAVFVFSNGDASALNAGPSLMFVTLPKVFADMPGGQIIGAAFFVLVLLAALTSSISLFETVVSVFQDRFHMNRALACGVTYVVSVVLGLLSSLGYNVLSNTTIFGLQFLDFFDTISNNYLMPIVALITCIIVGWVVKPKFIIEEAEVNGAKFSAKKLFTIVIRYFAPVCIVLILLTSILSQLGILSL